MDETRREYVRVSASCPIHYRILNSENNAVEDKSRFDPFSLIGQPMTSKMDVGGDQQNARILELLLCIDWKLNYLMKTQFREQDRLLFPHEGIIHDLSGSGLGFTSERAEPVGTKLRFKLILPVIPFNEMSIDAEVIHSVQKGWNEDTTAKYEIGVEYLKIKEEDRELIFRFIVKRDRQIRLEQREQSS